LTSKAGFSLAWPWGRGYGNSKVAFMNRETQKRKLADKTEKSNADRCPVVAEIIDGLSASQYD